MENKYSVLMSVYYKEKPEYLRQSMQSIYDQTAPTDDFVLVCDGPLTSELDAVITIMQEKFDGRLRVYHLEKNGGLGNALNVGIKHCKNELVARMDSDDISRPDRCQKQLNVFAKNPAYSIVGGFIEEFSASISKIVGCRMVPEYQQDILCFAKKRNPFNHVSVMYKKSAVELSGGYKDFYLLEDYYLWLRMLQKGLLGYSLQEPLVWVRVGNDMYKRRGGWKYVQSQVLLFRYMYRRKFISYHDFILQSLVRILGSIIPNEIRAYLYKHMLR